MKINLTKLLENEKYTGEYGETSFVGTIDEGAGGKSPYAFELEEERRLND